MTHPTPTVVLMHGWPVTHLHWRQLTPALTEAGLQVIEVDLPGLGAPVPSELPRLGKQRLAEWVRETLRGRGVARYAVIGHDWGGTVGVLLAALDPAAVTALVIEEEILPGVDVQVPPPGSDHYPTWHGPFNRTVGLAEALVPGREAAYYGTFLTQSAGPIEHGGVVQAARCDPRPRSRCDRRAPTARADPRGARSDARRRIR